RATRRPAPAGDDRSFSASCTHPRPSQRAPGAGRFPPRFTKRAELGCSAMPSAIPSGPHSTLSLDELRHFIGLCDPMRPLDPGDPLYVPFDEGTPVRGGAGQSCIEALQRLIYLKEETRQLFTGFPGTGKTTELRRLEVSLKNARDLPTHAIYIDFEEYLDRYT